jgi:uncharacterized protein YgfB (UPF0149 family)
MFSSPRCRTMPPSHDRVSNVLASLRLGVNASDLHGSLTGYLCAGGRAGADDWLDRLELSPADAQAAHDGTLAALLAAALAQFGHDPAQVEPLLPTASATLALRADALVEWCRGFLGGFGLVGSTLHAHLSDDASEILADFGTIATSRLEIEGGASDEQAFFDVLDFVRLAVARLHRETGQSRRAATRSLH